MPDEEKPYEVARLTRFNEAMRAISEKYPRTHVPIDAAEKILRIRPYEAFDGIVINREDWRYFKVEAAPGVRSLNVYFRIDEENKRVYLIRADLCGEEEEDEGGV